MQNNQQSPCKWCEGTGMRKLGETLEPVVCIHCNGTGIAHEEANTHQRRHLFGPFYVYPNLKRDVVILIGLVLLLVVLRAVS